MKTPDHYFLKNYMQEKKLKDADSVRDLIIATCHWSKDKWNNKLQGRTPLTPLEANEILEIEIMLRIRDELNWSMSDYINKTRIGALLSDNELSVINKHKALTHEELFGASIAA